MSVLSSLSSRHLEAQDLVLLVRSDGSSFILIAGSSPSLQSNFFTTFFRCKIPFDIPHMLGPRCLYSHDGEPVVLFSSGTFMDVEKQWNGASSCIQTQHSDGQYITQKHAR